MKHRIMFKSPKERNLFFKEILKSSNLKNWKELSEKFKINRNVLADYRSGRLTIPQEMYKKTSSLFENNSQQYFNDKTSLLQENWGQKKGGKNAYLKNKIFFDKGREKAIRIKKEQVHRFDISLPLNNKLAYFIGLLIGDGFTNKYSRYYLTQFIGHLAHELDFYKKIISPLSKELFDIIPQIKEYKKINTLRANFYSKDLFLLITQRFKIPRGRKSSFVLIPQEILDSQKEVILSCVAGIYDAEGSLYYDRRESYGEPYPILELHMSNPELMKQISKILNRFNLFHYTRNSERIYFYGKKKIKNFLKDIPILNPKILKKIKN